MSPSIAVVATMDTKSAEAAFVRDELDRLGCSVRLVDVGLTPCDADVPADVVASAAGQDIDALREHARRDTAMQTMGRGASVLLGAWSAASELDGVLALGGNQGTAIAAEAMRALPFGLPKYVVSTVASGDVRGFVGDSDIVCAFSVGDLLGGPNAVTATVLRQASAAVAGMARVEPVGPPESAPPTVAVTAFGNTHGAVTSAIDRMETRGVRAVPFHASGASGSAMERLVSAGMFDGVLDLTTHELLAELYPNDIYRPVRPGRLTAAGQRGIPQVVAPGGLEYHCFAAAETIPAELRERPTHHHNPNNTNVRSSATELRHVARELAARLNAATGPVAVLVPTRGWSRVGAVGGPLHDPGADAQFVDEFRGSAGDGIDMREIEATINDRSFAVEAADTLLGLLRVLPQRP